MNKILQGRFSTGFETQDLRSPKDIEYREFARVTSMLRSAVDSGSQADLINSALMNNKLWTFLAADLANPHNGLPDPVKAGLLSLAAFSIKHGNLLMLGKGDATVLLDINKMIMKGLRSGGQDDRPGP